MSNRIHNMVKSGTVGLLSWCILLTISNNAQADLVLHAELNDNAASTTVTSLVGPAGTSINNTDTMHINSGTPPLLNGAFEFDELSDVVSWKTPEAFNITFDFLKPKEMNKVSLSYSGQLPEVALYGSNDGINWVDLNITTQKQPSTDDVPEKVLDGISGSYQFLQIRFAARDANCNFTLAEVEMWSK